MERGGPNKQYFSRALFRRVCTVTLPTGADGKERVSVPMLRTCARAETFRVA